jgi:hypothetical protein
LCTSHDSYSHTIGDAEPYTYSYNYSYPESYCYADRNAAAYTLTEAAPDSTPPALITQMIPKLRRKMGYLF